jgi:uncharacterized protein (AIM24 family)
METIFGDGSSRAGSGVLDALLGAGKRILTGESLFMTVFTEPGHGASSAWRLPRRTPARSSPWT